MSSSKLILAPRDPGLDVIPPAEIRKAFGEVGFVDEKAHVMPGPRFLELLPFAKQPPPGELWAPHTIEVTAPTDRIEFLGSADTVTPDCAACSTPIPDWPDVLSQRYESSSRYRWPCPSCGERSCVWDLEWHESCGFGRQSIDIWHIGFRDAVPSKRLLAVLDDLGPASWAYFYYRL